MIYMGHQESVHSIVWSPNGKMIASASDDHTVQIWDAGTGATVFSYAGHSDQVHTVTWSPDGRFIASGSVDQTVRVWAASSGHDLVVYYPHNTEVDTISWAPGPDSRYIVSGSKDEGAPNNSSIQAWDCTTSCRAFNISGYDRALSVAWSPDGTLIASGHGDEYARVWELIAALVSKWFTNSRSREYVPSWDHVIMRKGKR